jgi:hypothetical protein
VVKAAVDTTRQFLPTGTVPLTRTTLGCGRGRPAEYSTSPRLRVSPGCGPRHKAIEDSQYTILGRLRSVVLIDARTQIDVQVLE